MNDNNAPPPPEEAGGYVAVFSDGGMYELCSIKIGNESMPVGELLASICSHPNVQQELPGIMPSHMGLRTDEGRMYKHDERILPWTAVFLCQAKSDNIEVVTPAVFPSPPAARKLHPVRQYVGSGRNKNGLLKHLIESGSGAVKQWDMPENYKGKSQYLHDTIQDFMSKGIEHALITICKGKTVSIKVSSRGCRPKLALEMVCLYENLNRDEWKFSTPVDWVNPGSTLNLIRKNQVINQ